MTTIPIERSADVIVTSIHGETGAEKAFQAFDAVKRYTEHSGIKAMRMVLNPDDYRDIDEFALFQCHGAASMRLWDCVVVVNDEFSAGLCGVGVAVGGLDMFHQRALEAADAYVSDLVAKIDCLAATSAENPA